MIDGYTAPSFKYTQDKVPYSSLLFLAPARLTLDPEINYSLFGNSLEGANPGSIPTIDAGSVPGIISNLKAAATCNPSAPDSPSFNAVGAAAYSAFTQLPAAVQSLVRGVVSPIAGASAQPDRPNFADDSTAAATPVAGLLSSAGLGGLIAPAPTSTKPARRSLPTAAPRFAL